MSDLELASTMELVNELKTRADNVVIIVSESGQEGTDEWILAWNGTIPGALGYMDIARERFLKHLRIGEEE